MWRGQIRSCLPLWVWLEIKWKASEPSGRMEITRAPQLRHPSPLPLLFGLETLPTLSHQRWMNKTTVVPHADCSSWWSLLRNIPCLWLLSRSLAGSSLCFKWQKKTLDFIWSYGNNLCSIVLSASQTTRSQRAQRVSQIRRYWMMWWRTLLNDSFYWMDSNASVHLKQL